MLAKTNWGCFLTILIGVVFLGAQLHCCVDLGPNAKNSHVCPVCSTVGTAIVISYLVITMVPAIDALDIFASIVFARADFSRATPPRAPPIL